jgi:hypothetical protein
MSYVRWSTLWHVILPDDLVTLCGRPVPDEAAFRDLPPAETFICSVCGKRA